MARRVCEILQVIHGLVLAVPDGTSYRLLALVAIAIVDVEILICACQIHLDPGDQRARARGVGLTLEGKRVARGVLEIDVEACWVRVEGQARIVCEPDEHGKARLCGWDLGTLDCQPL